MAQQTHIHSLLQYLNSSESKMDFYICHVKNYPYFLSGNVDKGLINWSVQGHIQKSWLNWDQSCCLTPPVPRLLDFPSYNARLQFVPAIGNSFTCIWYAPKLACSGFWKHASSFYRCYMTSMINFKLWVISSEIRLPFLHYSTRLI